MSEHIQFDFIYDNHFSELKEAELMQERLNLIQVAEPYVGRYFSQDYVRRKILRQSDDEMLEQDDIIQKEIKQGVIADPYEMDMAVDGLGQPAPVDNPQNLHHHRQRVWTLEHQLQNQIWRNRVRKLKLRRGNYLNINIFSLFILISDG